MTLIDLSVFHNGQAKLAEADKYIQLTRDQVTDGADVVLTGNGPIWLYLKIAHDLHGRAKSLRYRSPVTGDVMIFDHDPF